MIWLSKNQKHKLEQQQKEELERYKNWMRSLSNELVDWCIKKSLSVADFENVVNYTKERFQLSFGQKKIDKLQSDK